MNNQNRETPPDFLQALQRKFGIFEFDVAANDDGSDRKCLLHLVGDALAMDANWFPTNPTTGTQIKRVYCNPPYAKLLPWFRQARFQVDNSGNNLAIVVLVNHVTVGSFWCQEGRTLATEQYLCWPRVQFFNPEKPEERSNDRDSMISIFSVGGFTVDQTSHVGIWNWKDTDIAAYYGPGVND